MTSKHFAISALALLATPALIAADYSVNYPDGTVINNGSRTLHSVRLLSPTDGMQSIESSQADDRALYHDRTSLCLSAAAGEKVTVNFDWTGSWMHGYVYIDCDNDGKFDASSGSDRDVMAYSNYAGVNSDGTQTNDGNVGVNPPAFIVPDLTPGLYRIRFKIDWNSIDPGGHTGDNLITDNGGAITDAMIYIHDAGTSFTATTDGGTLIDTATGRPADASSLTAGVPLTLKPTPDEGYVFDALTISSGYDCGSQKVIFANQALQHTERTYPSFLLRDGALTIPAEMLCGDVAINATFLPGEIAAEGEYECQTNGAKDPARGITSITAAGVNQPVASTDRYHFLRETAIGVTAGQPFTVTADYTGSATPLRLYVDYGQDGVFSAIDGASSSDLLGTLGGDSSFTLHPMLPAGVYRARLEAPGDCTVDFLLNVHLAEGKLDVKAMNGNVVATDGSALPLTVAYGSVLLIKPMPVLPGYTASHIIVRHGQNLDGPAYIKGNRQWQDTQVAIGSNMTPITSALTDGDIEIYAIYEEQPSSQWTKVWGDEFNGDSIDPNRWGYQQRQGATWNRLTAQNDEIPLVNIVEDGHYKAYCIPTPDQFKPQETQDMISAAIHSQGKFHFTYGRVEARIKTNRHTGNFPAFWMMPQEQPLGWPKDGEIDIWEQIDDAQNAYHTIHSGWTYKSFSEDCPVSTPQSSGNEWIDHDRWHVFALEWDAEQLRWYVDGQQKFAYNNQHYNNGGSYTEQITWPFYKDFYIILNQSVGNGAWAQWCDTEHTYLTEFDWVRVYKRKGDDAFTTNIDSNGDDPDFYVEPEDPFSEIIDVINPGQEATGDQHVIYYDMRGIMVDTPSAPGLYIERRGSTATKILKH